MGIREQLNEKPAITTGATIGIILLALIFIIYELHGTNTSYKIPTQRYYSDDDGATYFADDIKLVPPFEHNGKQAVIAGVYRCRGSGPFIAYLERYTPRGAEAIRKAQESRTPSGTLPIGELEMSESEYSLPNAGPRGWVKATDKRAAPILDVKCPDGTVNSLDIVAP